MKIGAYFTATIFLIGLTSIASPSYGAAAHSQSCSKDIAVSIAQAHKAIDANSPAEDRTALSCLLSAVAALDERVRGLSNGSIPFDGQIYAPKGVGMTKPLTKEAR